MHDEKLLVFTHDEVPLEVAGIQVPAGTIDEGETPEAAVVREVLEETGLHTRVVQDLGSEDFDVWPSKAEIHERYFFHLAPVDGHVPERWKAGEPHPSGGGSVTSWTCWWLPITHAHVLCAGFSARIGRISATEDKHGMGCDRSVEV